MPKNQLLSRGGVKGSPQSTQRPSNALSCLPDSWLGHLSEQRQRWDLHSWIQCHRHHSAWPSEMPLLSGLWVLSTGQGWVRTIISKDLTHSSFGKIYKGHSHSAASPIQDNKQLFSKSQIILEGQLSGS